MTYTPAPSGPKREADCSRFVLLPLQSGMKGETVKRVAVHGGKGGHMIRVSRGDGSDCVAEEQNDLQEGFFFNRQGTLLVAWALRLEKSGGRRRARSKEERA